MNNHKKTNPNKESVCREAYWRHFIYLPLIILCLVFFIMQTKICTVCNGSKNVNEFYKSSKGCKLGLHSQCKSCSKKRLTKYVHSKVGLIGRIHISQVYSSINRSHPPPAYTLQELREWCFFQPKFHELYDNWVKSGFAKSVRPSCDRKNDYKGYSFNNIQLMTWFENRQKSYEDQKNGINNKNSRSVIGTHKVTGGKVEFYSASEAGRRIGIDKAGIIKCCSGSTKYSHSGGYIWRYKNKINEKV